MSARWYYQLFMEEFGPVTVEQLRDLFEEGTLGDVDQVRCETDDVWTTVALLKQTVFAGASKRSDQAMEEIGDLSELAFEFEDSGPTARRGAYPQESTEEASPVSTEAVFESLMESLSPVSADVGPSVSSPRVLTPPPAGDERAEEWFCESFGQVLGPMSFDELIELGESGALDANDRVRCGQRGLWKTVDCLPSVMRAVAVGRAIELDPAIFSATTQKRPDEVACEAIVNATHAPVEPMAELPQPPLQEPQSASSVEGVAAVQPQSPGTISEKSKATKPRPKRRKNAKDDDKLLNEIFDDVFNDDAPPVRSNTTAQSVAAAATVASAASSMNIPTQTTPSTMSPQHPPTAAYSSPASHGSSHAVGAKLAAAAIASRSSSRSSGRSFEANPATIRMLVAVLLVAAGGWYVWQNGIPFGASNGNGSFDSAGAIEILEATRDRYKAMGDNPSESEWNALSDKTKEELGVLFKTVYDRAGATPKGAACLAATMCLMKIARTKPDNKESVDKNLAEYERQIAVVKK